MAAQSIGVEPLKLMAVEIDHFKHVLNSGEVKIEPDITCLVGQNESGKSTFLEALRRLKPAQGAVEFDSPKHYPAWLEKRHRRQAKSEGKDLNDKTPIKAVFELEPADISYVELLFGQGVLTSNEFTLWKTYANNFRYSVSVDEKKAVANMLDSFKVDAELPNLREAQSFEELRALLEQHSEDEDISEAAAEIVASVQKRIAERLPEEIDFSREVYKHLANKVPKFFYYSEYSSLPSRVPIRTLLDADPDTLDENDQTALALLQLAEFEKDHLLDTDYETRKRELENVANELTQDVLQYWSTNKNLRVLIDLTLQAQNVQNGRSTVVDELQVRMHDDQHMLSLPFDERSSGFRWFFSFLTAFSRYEFDDTPVIILLDEPALGLHARAQKDFLRFIEERLSKRCQVIYTTHSPFMIEPSKLERTRLVEDKGQELGSVTTSEVLTTNSDTLFPLQAALGYDIAQHLFIAKDNLVVEGPSDLIFMDAISGHLKANGREGLDERWAIMPLGGADVIPAFVALLGNHLDVTVVVDSRKEGHQKLTALAKAGFLTETRIITIGEMTDQKMADIEDLFSAGDYVFLYNKAFGTKVKVADLTGSDPIVRQIARLEGIDRFNHDAPANALLRSKESALSKLSEETLTAFEGLFKRINGTLS
ncbi:AAA family ATPase [Thalassospira alkalitolerans]|uniref:AAA family ATPase n=1 Tax=Thalassospira alkalitolerans TaxID=1293890 RepID=UPI003AA93811